MNWRILKKISIAVIDVFKAFNHKSETPSDYDLTG